MPTNNDLREPFLQDSGTPYTHEPIAQEESPSGIPVAIASIAGEHLILEESPSDIRVPIASIAGEHLIPDVRHVDGTAEAR